MYLQMQSLNGDWIYLPYSQPIDNMPVNPSDLYKSESDGSIQLLLQLANLIKGR